jgi:predicted RNase H-like HicB family nuclease
MTSRIKERIAKTWIAKECRSSAGFSTASELIFVGAHWPGVTTGEHSSVQNLAGAIAQLQTAGEAIAKGTSNAARIAALEERILALENRRPTVVVTTIKSLACADIEVVKGIPVTIESDEDAGFIASFMDAGIASGGETIPEAVESLQEIVAVSFRTLEKMADANLGPKMRRQKLVLMEFLCPASQKTTQKNSQKS